jgi:hypothetical protein
VLPAEDLGREAIDAVEALPLDERPGAYLAAHRLLQERLGVASA